MLIQKQFFFQFKWLSEGKVNGNEDVFFDITCVKVDLCNNYFRSLHIIDNRKNSHTHFFY